MGGRKDRCTITVPLNLRLCGKGVFADKGDEDGLV